MDQLKIRKYRPADRKRLDTIMRESLRAVDQIFAEIPLDTGQCYVEEFIQSGGELLVGEVNNQIVASGGFRPVEESMAEFLNVADNSVVEIKRLYVLPRYQRRGYGTQILSRLENVARHQGRSVILIEVFELQDKAIEFYESSNYSNIKNIWKGYSEDSLKIKYYKKNLDHAMTQ